MLYVAKTRICANERYIWLKTASIGERRQRGNPERNICIQDCWAGLRGEKMSSNQQSCGVGYLPHTQLSTLLTLDTLHIKEPSLQKRSHLQGKSQGARAREHRGREGGEGGQEGQGRATTLRRSRSIIQNKKINSSCVFLQLERPWKNTTNSCWEQCAKKNKTAWKILFKHKRKYVKA